MIQEVSNNTSDTAFLLSIHTKLLPTFQKYMKSSLATDDAHVEGKNGETTFAGESKKSRWI